MMQGENRRTLLRQRRVRRIRGLSIVAMMAALFTAVILAAYAMIRGDQRLLVWSVIPLIVAVMNGIAYWRAPYRLRTSRHIILWSVVGGLGLSVLTFGFMFGTMALFLAWTVVLSAMLFGPQMLIIVTALDVILILITGLLELLGIIPIIPLDAAFIRTGNFILALVYPLAMAGSIHLYADYIQDTLNDIASRLEEEAEAVVGSAQQQASASQELAASVQEISMTAEELSHTAEHISQHSQRLDEIVQQGHEHIQASQEEISQILDIVTRFAEEMRLMSQDVLRLGEQSQKVGEIIDIINRISDETHLIALNAAIEAAGAGEHGKRFAVIAAEIRRLAENSLKSGEQIKALIGDFQHVIDRVVKTLEGEIDFVSHVGEQVQSAHGRLAEIVEFIKITSTSSHDLAKAAADLNNVSQQLAMSLHDLSQAAEEIADTSQHNLETAKALAELAATIARSGV